VVVVDGAVVLGTVCVVVIGIVVGTEKGVVIGVVVVIPSCSKQFTKS
jgi:hypothetical protein